MAKTPWVDKDECISCGACMANCPGVFRMGADGKSECYDATGATEEDIQNNAIDTCPVSCIHWQE
jgi:ferredoxin